MNLLDYIKIKKNTLIRVRTNDAIFHIIGKGFYDGMINYTYICFKEGQPATKGVYYLNPDIVNHNLKTGDYMIGGRQ